MPRSNTRTRILFRARPARRAAGIDHLFVLRMQVGQHLRLGAHGAVILPGGEVAVAQRFLALSQHPAFSFPLGDAAIQDRHVVCAEHLEHEPGARRSLHRAVIVQHDAAAIAKAQRLHAAGELFRRGQHVFNRVAGVGQVSEVHENRAGNVPGFIFGQRIAARTTEVFGAIDNSQIACAHFIRKPLGRNQTIHNALILLAQVDSPASALFRCSCEKD